MAALETPAGELGWQAKDFTLKDAYGSPFRLYDLKGPTGKLVMFICPTTTCDTRTTPRSR